MLFHIACELILDLPQRPTQYDPNRLSLAAYLLIESKRDVLNAIQREQRRTRRIVPLEAVELQPLTRNNEYVGEADPVDVVIRVAAHGEVEQMCSIFWTGVCLTFGAGGLGDVLLEGGARRRA